MRSGAGFSAFGAGAAPALSSVSQFSPVSISQRDPAAESGRLAIAPQAGRRLTPFPGTTLNHGHISVSQKLKNYPGCGTPCSCNTLARRELSQQRKGAHMRKIGLTLAAVAALATTAVVNSPAEARGGRNAAIGFGVAAGVLGAAAAANAYNNGYYYGPRYGYYDGGPYGYYDDGPRYYRRHYRLLRRLVRKSPEQSGLFLLSGFAGTV